MLRFSEIPRNSDATLKVLLDEIKETDVEDHLAILEKESVNFRALDVKLAGINDIKNGSVIEVLEPGFIFRLEKGAEKMFFFQSIKGCKILLWYFETN
ncbi:hypothetical protein L6452_05953 [Arctium lappa]|uniref:Uncharacterized protein n=1 Tax=Arctium lappa TaxID=4217 RepID=A0ACB9EHS1_ARCLA|nr:hypothetical protein L6452_05953 [Arctium lappa]